MKRFFAWCYGLPENTLDDGWSFVWLMARWFATIAFIAVTCEATRLYVSLSTKQEILHRHGIEITKYDLYWLNPQVRIEANGKMNLIDD